MTMAPPAQKGLSALVLMFLIALTPNRSLASTASRSSAEAPVAPLAKPEPLREATWRLERLFRESLESSAEGLPSAQSPPSFDRLEARLLRLRQEADRLDPTERKEWKRKVLSLEPLLRALRQKGVGGTTSTALTTATGHSWHPSDLRSAERVEAAAHSQCAEALEVDDGLFGAGIPSTVADGPNELWLSYTAKESGLVGVSTAGSRIDTTLEAYAACPGAGSVVSLTHGDDEIGLQARIGFPIAKEQTVWLRVGGSHGATGSRLSGLIGTVTREGTSEPISFEEVRVWRSDGSYLTSSETDGSGVYSVAGIEAGTYFVSTSLYDTDGLLDELYDNIPCPGGASSGCDPAMGTPVLLLDGEVVNGIDFALGTGASLAGRLRDRSTGQPLPGHEVQIFGPSGSLISELHADVAGRFQISGLGDGNVFAVAREPYYGEGLYASQLYQNLPCPFCDPTQGTPIPLVIGSTSTGIDFDLDLLGAIEGTLTRVLAPVPIPFEEIQIHNESGSTVQFTSSDAQGHYRASGLEPGTYFVTTSSYGLFYRELYEEIPCEPSCDPTTGTPVEVTTGAVTGGIDFELNRFAEIRGTVTDEVTGEPIIDVRVRLWDESGGYSDLHFTDSLGHYSFDRVRIGTYFVSTDPVIYLGELYDDLPCNDGCDVTQGTPLVVGLDSTIEGIDFGLIPLGRIEGAVTEEGSGDLIDSFEVRVWDENGFLVAETYPDYGSSTYQVLGLEVGNFFVSVTANNYLGEVFDNLSCPAGPPADCDPTLGTPVSVIQGAATTGIDLALLPKGSISGAVSRADGGAPLSFANLSIYDQDGNFATSTSASNDGSFRVLGLEAGAYFVVSSHYGFLDQLYEGFPCPYPSCVPTTGTPVNVNIGEATTGIDFELQQRGRISGQVSSTHGGTSYGSVQVFDEAGNLHCSETVTIQEPYEIEADSGTYFVFFDGGPNFSSQLFDGFPCADPCDVTTGTPVTVAADSVTSGIDFEVTPTTGILGQVTNAETASHLFNVAIDLWNSSGVHVATALTNPNGLYSFEVGTGSYFVSSDNGVGGVDEIWNNVPCPLGSAFEGLCDPLAGTPLEIVAYDTLLEGIDFHLEFSEIFSDGFESGNTTAWSLTFP